MLFISSLILLDTFSIIPHVSSDTKWNILAALDLKKKKLTVLRFLVRKGNHFLLKLL